MSTRLVGSAPVGIVVDGQGIEFAREYRGEGVEICVEYSDLGAWSSRSTLERYVTISREDWNAIVAHIGGAA